MTHTRRFRAIAATLSIFLATVFGSAQQSPPTLSPLQHMRRLPGAIAQTNEPKEDSSASTAPQWSSSFQYTVDTALAGASSVYNPASNVMTVFAGLNWGKQGADTNAVLLFTPATSNGAWSTLIAAGTAGSPPAREGHTAVYDSATNRMTIFGGATKGTTGSHYFSDAWVLTNADGQGGTATWSKLIPLGPSPATRWLHTAVFDSGNNRMMVFGGDNGSQTFSDVWVLSHANGLGGSPTWTHLLPGGSSPKGVDSSSAVYDPFNNIMIVFGGENLARNAFTNGVWTLSHANGLGGTPQWTNIVADNAAGSPAKRCSHTAVYDTENNRMTIFGGGAFAGSSSLSGFSDAWVLSTANGLGDTPTWTKLATAGLKPGPRTSHTAVYDVVNNQMMVFGGQNADAAYYVTWVLTHANGL